MKKTIFTAPLFFFLLLFFISCRKEGSGSRLTEADSTVLRQTIMIDTTRTPGHDTLGKTSFKYDDRNRLVKATNLGYLLGPAPVNISEFELQYEGTDILPKLFISRIWSDYATYGVQPADHCDSVYFFYSDGKIMRDSLLFYQSPLTTVITTYTEIQPGHFKININEKYRTGGAYFDRGNYNVYVKKQDNDFTELKDTIPFFGGPVARKINFTYDNKINPLKKIALRYPVLSHGLFDGYTPQIIPLFLLNTNEHNTASFTRDQSPAAGVSLSYGYDYLMSGLPSQQRTLSARDYNILFRYHR